MFRFVTTLVLLWISAFASAQDTANTTETPEVVWGGCLDPFTGNSKVTIGEPTAICLVFANNENWFNKTVDYTRLTFLPTADEYSRFIVPASYQDMVSSPISDLSIFSGNNITLHAESGLRLSYQKHYRDQNSSIIYNQFTVIIEVSEGVVTDITWDDGCIFCNSDNCNENIFDFTGEAAATSAPGGSCGTPESECTESISSTGKGSACDVTIYTVWTGTDTNGEAFKSAAYRFSAFPKQDWTDNIPSFNIPTSFEDLGVSFEDLGVTLP